jgi:hypothetical protein
LNIHWPLAILSTLVALAFALSACGGSPAPTPTWTPVLPEPTAVPEPTVHVEMAGYDSYRDIYGQFWFVGQVSNKGPEPAGDVRVTISVVGSDGDVLATGFAESGRDLPSVIPSGEKAAFRVTIDRAPEKWASIGFQVQAEPAVGAGLEDRYFDLRAQNDTLAPAAGEGRGPTVTGEIMNTGRETAASVQVWAAGYGEDGEVLDATCASVTLDRIAPDNTAPFEIEFHSDANGRIVKYVLWAEANRLT